MKHSFDNYEEALKHPEDVKTLSFSFNDSYRPYTKALPDARIGTLLNLERFFISGYKEKRMVLPKELSALKKLRQIHIYAENLEEVPSVLWEVSSLEDLFFQTNFLKTDAVHPARLPNLRWFGIKVNKTERVPDQVFENPNLTCFCIQSDDLQTLPNQFDRLQNLEKVVLHCQSLQTIPESIGTLTALKEIDIYNKTATKIDIQFGELSLLKDFRWGQSLFFPLNVADAPNLERMTLDVSYFENINAESINFSKLKILDLSHAKLRSMPRCFESLETISTLMLPYGQFTEFDFNFERLNNLLNLSFRDSENFGNVDMGTFTRSIVTVKNLSMLETPLLTKTQKAAQKKVKFNFEWIES